MHKKKQALLNERMLVLFTAIIWEWNNYNATKNQRKRIAIAACRQITYNRGFANNLASSQLSAWNRKIYEGIQSGSSFDQESNPLFSDHFGTVKCTDIIEQQYSTYIREMFRYAQRVNGAKSSFVELTHTINQKSYISEESRPSLKMHPLQLYRCFVSNKGKELYPKEKPLDTSAHKSNRLIWAKDWYNILTDKYANIAMLDEK